jgi:hypothetical protein
MNGFRKIFPIFLSHYATFFAKMAERKVVPFDEFYYQLKFMHLFQKHPVYARLWVRAKIFCCDRNGAFSRKLHWHHSILIYDHVGTMVPWTIDYK